MEPRPYRRSLWPLYKRILQHSNRPILVGPFTGEVGFETLYWLPWLEQFIHECGIDRARIIPISRGGAAAWYRVPRGIELYAMRSVTDVRVAAMLHHNETRMLKQMTVSAFERQVLRDAAATLQLSKYHVLHPAWMYQDLAPFWHAERGPAWLQRKVRFATPGIPTLPEDIAAKLP